MDVEVDTMRALVVVESWFRSTRAVADAVAQGFRPFIRVDLRRVGIDSLTLDQPTDLLIVGGPTHPFGMSRPEARADAAMQARHGPTAEIGVRERLESMPRGVLGHVAALDTRIDRGSILGSAAHGIAKRLRAAGELDRAKHWGRQLAPRLSMVGVPDTDRRYVRTSNSAGR